MSPKVGATVKRSAADRAEALPDSRANLAAGLAEALPGHPQPRRRPRRNATHGESFIAKPLPDVPPSAAPVSEWSVGRAGTFESWRSSRTTALAG